MIRVHILLAASGGILAALFLASGAALADVSEVGVDADPAGNGPAALGEIDECVEVSAGDTFAIDIYAKDVEELIAFRATLWYDPAIVQIADRDAELFLSTAENASVQDLSDPTPDADGQYELTAVNTSTPSTGASGTGVLARVTLTAVGPGISQLDLENRDLNEDLAIDRGVYLADLANEPQGSDDGDIYYDGPLHLGAVAVDANCADAATPVLGDDGGDVPWLVIAIVALVVAVVGAGGAIAWRRRSGPRTGA